MMKKRLGAAEKAGVRQVRVANQASFQILLVGSVANIVRVAGAADFEVNVAAMAVAVVGVAGVTVAEAGVADGVVLLVVVEGAEVVVLDLADREDAVDTEEAAEAVVTVEVEVAEVGAVDMEAAGEAEAGDTGECRRRVIRRAEGIEDLQLLRRFLYRCCLSVKARMIGEYRRG